MATFYAGKVGYVTDDLSNVYAFSKWRYKPRAKIVSRNNYTSLGKDESVAGFIGADITLEGPFDAALPAVLTVGELYTFSLGIEDDGPTEFVVQIRISDVEVSNDAEDAPNMTVSGVTHGGFEPSVLQQPG
jgi:hypothetical protein